MSVKRDGFKMVPGLKSVCAVAAMLLLMCEKDPQVAGPQNWECAIPDGPAPDYSGKMGCLADFKTLSSKPLDASIPGQLSVKTVIDQSEGNALYFQDSKKYLIHHDFAYANLSVANGKMLVPELADFNKTEYYTPTRRFVLGAIIYYEAPDIWTYEIAPYDNASASMIRMAYEKIADSSFFGEKLYFHPSSVDVEKVAKSLPSSVKIITTDELYKDIDYQPLNYGTSYGRLVFITAKSLDTSYVSFRDIVVLDQVPNDISVTSGIITEAFQTPLAHINVLSQNRGTPNMAARGIFTDTTLRKLEGKWVKFEVSAFEYSVTETTQAEADLWWEAHKPKTVGVAKMNLDIRELRNVEDILVGLSEDHSNLKEAIDSAIPAFGGKTSHFSAFPHMDNTKVPYPKAFGVPVYFYYQFMEQNGFNKQVDSMLADPQFAGDPAVRDKRLKKLRKDMENAPVDTAFEKMLMAKLNTEFPGQKMRFRSSTNAEDLDGFTGAGLYTSKAGDPNDPNDPVLDAVKEVWSSVWYFRAFEERSYRSIDHKSVGMALLVHRSFPTEEASGVAITANPFDASSLEPAFYVNVQAGDASVVLPEAQVTTDQFIYYFYYAGQPIVYMAHSNLIPDSATVLTVKQIHTLGVALNEIHEFFAKAYRTDPNAWYAMDTEFKFDQAVGDPNGEPVLTMKQARPYPGMGK